VKNLCFAFVSGILYLFMISIAFGSDLPCPGPGCPDPVVTLPDNREKVIDIKKNNDSVPTSLKHDKKEKEVIKIPETEKGKDDVNMIKNRYKTD